MVVFNKLIPELIVSDIKASSRFYCKIIGFTLEYERPNDGFMFISYHGSQLMLEQDYAEESPWRVGPLQKPYGRGINLSIECPDVKALAKTLMGSGYKLHKPIEERWYKANNSLQGQSNFLVLDPDGYLLRFAQDLGPKPIMNELQ